MSPFLSLKRCLLSTGNHFRGHYLQGTYVCGVYVCVYIVITCCHNSYLCCFNYDQENHHHQIPVATIHPQNLTLFVFHAWKGVIWESRNDSYFQLLLSSGTKHNRFQGGMWKVREKGITLWKLMATDKNKLLKNRAPFDTEQALIPTVLTLAGTSTEKWKPWLFQPFASYPRKSCWYQLPDMLQVSAIGSAWDLLRPT